jgi:site-specific recombinase XerD
MRLVQEALGHEDLRARRIDIHIVNEELEEAMKTSGRGGSKYVTRLIRSYD